MVFRAPQSRVVIGNNRMADHSHLVRVLALDVRPRRFGFVVFEGAQHLLDWGVRSHAEPDAVFGESARKRITELLDMFEPSLIVVRAPSARGKEVSARTWAVLKIVREQATRRSVAFIQISPRKLRRFFLRQGCATKQQRATILAKWYPDLQWKLPPRRKPWQSEDFRMSVFDAAALGTAYLALKPNESRGRTDVRSDGRVLI